MLGGSSRRRTTACNTRRAECLLCTGALFWQTQAARQNIILVGGLFIDDNGDGRHVAQDNTKLVNETLSCDHVTLKTLTSFKSYNESVCVRERGR